MHIVSKTCFIVESVRWRLHFEKPSRPNPRNAPNRHFGRHFENGGPKCRANSKFVFKMCIYTCSIAKYRFSRPRNPFLPLSKVYEIFLAAIFQNGGPKIIICDQNHNFPCSFCWIHWFNGKIGLKHKFNPFETMCWIKSFLKLPARFKMAVNMISQPWWMHVKLR